MTLPRSLLLLLLHMLPMLLMLLLLLMMMSMTVCLPAMPILPIHTSQEQWARLEIIHERGRNAKPKQRKEKDAHGMKKEEEEDRAGHMNPWRISKN